MSFPLSFGQNDCAFLAVHEVEKLIDEEKMKRFLPNFAYETRCLLWKLT